MLKALERLQQVRCPLRISGKAPALRSDPTHGDVAALQIVDAARDGQDSQIATARRFRYLHPFYRTV